MIGIFNMFLFYDHFNKPKNGLQQDHNSEMSGQRQEMSSQQEESTSYGMYAYALITLATVGAVVYYGYLMGFTKDVVQQMITEVKEDISAEVVKKPRLWERVKSFWERVKHFPLNLLPKFEFEPEDTKGMLELYYLYRIVLTLSVATVHYKVFTMINFVNEFFITGLFK